MTSIHDFSSANQPIFSDESTIESTSNADTVEIAPELWTRDETDLFILGSIAKSPDGSEINDILPKLAITYSALATRMLKLTNAELAVRTRRAAGIRSQRPPYAYFLRPGVTLEAIEEVAKRRGIDIKQFEAEQANKRTQQAIIGKVKQQSQRAVEGDTEDSLEEAPWQSTQYDQEEERNGKVHKYWNSHELRQLQLEQEQEDLTSGSANAETKVTGVTNVDSLMENKNSLGNTYIQPPTESFEDGVKKVLTIMAKEIATLKDEVAQLKQQLAQNPQIASSFNANEVLSILDPSQNGKGRS